MKVRCVLLRSLSVVISIAFFLVCSFFLLVPVLKTVRIDETYYECLWDDGSRTTESYFTAYGCLVGVDGGDILLFRGGMYGRIPSQTIQRQGAVLRQGNLGELLSLDASAREGLESAALFRAYSPTLYYANGEYFRFTGERVKRVARTRARRLSLLSGAVTASAVKKTGATELYLHKEAGISGATLWGSEVVAIAAEEPYSVLSGAVYFGTPAGERLVAAVPTAQSLYIKNVAFLDSGALYACQSLTGLSLPYAGEAPNAPDGEGKLFARIFSDGTQYCVPETLRRVTVRGGELVAHAFYACGHVQEIDACGVERDRVSPNAFADCTSLKYLHASRDDLVLPFAEFKKSKAPCGCTVYERREAA